MVIAELLRGTLSLQALILPDKQRVLDALALYTETNVSFADAYHAIVAIDLGLDAILSFDRGFDRIPGLRRIEP